jgi:L-ascorbate metabolism protein UlaG (beta-lactamase superfamily)
MTFVCNDGFTVATAGKKILIDALFDDTQSICGHGWDEAVADSQPLFDNADLVLVSHSHWDHFGAQQVGAYLQTNPQAELVAEKSAADELAKSFQAFDEVKTRVHSVEAVDGQPAELTVNGIPVVAISAPADVPNLAFLLNVGDLVCLHTGDSGLGPEAVAAFESYAWPEQGIDIAFVPYWYLTDSRGQPILQEGIRAASYIPMHYAGENLDTVFSAVRGAYPTAILFRKTLQTWSQPTHGAP